MKMKMNRPRYSHGYYFISFSPSSFERNFDAELYACSHRFSEKLNIESLKRAMTDASFISQIIKQRTDAGLTIDDKTSLTFEHNEEVSKKGYYRNFFNRNFKLFTSNYIY